MNKPINKLLIYISNSNKETLKIVTICLKNSISIEIINTNELYFFIYDTEHFNKLQGLLSTEIINSQGFNL